MRNGINIRVIAPVLIFWLAAGCRSVPQRVHPDPIPMPAAIEIVHRNLDRIDATLRAVGSVDGQAVDAEGRIHGYHVNGVLFHLAPRYFRFDLKKFGERQLLVGSNATDFWVYIKEEDTYRCGHHGEASELVRSLPIRPDQMVEALGLSPMETRGRASAVQRVVDDFQQILFLADDENGQPVLEKEYWLDRGEPRLVRRVIFRDNDGVVEMESHLDDYRATEVMGLLLPHSLWAQWPRTGASMRFRVDRWTLIPQVGPDGPQFATPAACQP